jgi:hypothetical protein
MIFFQKVDGFLALLSVSGGCWAPPSQKIPFSVTCVDEESCLLYYASIKLSGISIRKKNKGLPYGGIDSTSQCFMIPVKGRIRLVKLCIPWLFHIWFWQFVKRSSFGAFRF